MIGRPLPVLPLVVDAEDKVRIGPFQGELESEEEQPDVDRHVGGDRLDGVGEADDEEPVGAETQKKPGPVEGGLALSDVASCTHGEEAHDHGQPGENQQGQLGGVTEKTKGGEE